ncbi:MBL fold metallo-hydrolase [Tepidimicrobium xylanilyticum]|uniref:Glyoxylase, beta-lactamase superfamily II n=1 Tax=Tepidimicrobium xylanilyticum TaxID=1123352 RepID=A0A1H2Z829_9FIRM|nr:MBL fold metallo-hydrolase [Tepidimicrobium xylanilyticum]SDX13485.1 Glyoxylase, beta-lactamase superfamily II [Tepidimicrobium xylanilyticum]
MVLEIYPDIYLLEIPLPNNPLRSLNSYVIKSKELNLIIDTGFNIEECKDAFMKGLKDLNINIENTSLLITHLHSDHSGLAASLNQKGVKVYAGEIDGNMINEMTKEEYWKRFDDYKILFDLERDNISIDDHPGYKYCPKKPIDFIPLEEGQILTIGNYKLEVVDIPGHTPGHIGLYEREHRLFFGGDHVLNRITPNISFWGFNGDILSIYFESLKKVYDYSIDFLFSSHRSIVTAHRKRIEQLLKHHAERLNEIRGIIKDKKMSIRDVASKMHWDLRCDSWEYFPSPQKWFASGEAMSHLEHLAYIGEAERTEKNGILYYKLIG